MQCLKTITYLHQATPPLKPLLPACSPYCLPSPPSSLCFRRPASPPRHLLHFQSQMPPITTVEHVVLFKVRNSTDSSQIDAMIARIRSLVHIDAVSHLSVGRILRCRSDAADTSSRFTVLLHSRYRSKPDLDAYAVHPSHVAVVKENSKICEDVMAIDWITDLDGPISPQPGSAMRLELLKPRDRAAAAEIVKAIDEGRSSVPSAVQVSYGENFSPARAKGFEVGFISIFPGLDELDEIEGKEEIKAQEEKMKPLLESSIVIDFVIPSPDCSL